MNNFQGCIPVIGRILHKKLMITTKWTYLIHDWKCHMQIASMKRNETVTLVITDNFSRKKNSGYTLFYECRLLGILAKLKQIEIQWKSAL